MRVLFWFIWRRVQQAYTSSLTDRKVLPGWLYSFCPSLFRLLQNGSNQLQLLVLPHKRGNTKAIRIIEAMTQIRNGRIDVSPLIMFLHCFHMFCTRGVQSRWVKFKLLMNTMLIPKEYLAAFRIETTNEKSSGEKRVIREKMSLASFPWKDNSNKPLSSKKIAGVRTRGKESRSVAA